MKESKEETYKKMRGRSLDTAARIANFVAAKYNIKPDARDVADMAQAILNHSVIEWQEAANSLILSK